MYGVQQVLIHADSEIRAILEFICEEANKLANCGLYYCRQMLFKAGRYVKKYHLDSQMKNHPHFRSLRSCCAQQLLHDVAESFSSYKGLLSLWNKGQLPNKPKPPKYRKKGGMAVVSYPSRYVKQSEKGLKFSLGEQVKAWFGIDIFYLPMPSNLRFEDIKEFRLVPRNISFYLECVYEQPAQEKVKPNNKVLGIDHGLNNWLTCVSNTGKSFVIDGRKVKSQNQWYNKRIAQIKTGKPQGYWDQELAILTEKRNRQMRDNVNKAARFVINWCLNNDISTIVFGWNQRQKDSIELGKQVNQEFVQVPTAKLKGRIKQLSEQYGINLIETEESYTSKASFLDNDLLPKFGEKPEGWQSSGKRIQRGLFKAFNGQLINADCNGAANIIKKVATQLGVSLDKVGRASLTVPQRYKLDRLSKIYRNRIEAQFQPASIHHKESLLF